MGTFLFVVWQITIVLQMFFGFGTAYRLTRDGGDNGASLFGWLFAMNLAAIIPGLGFYIWNKYRDENNYTSVHYRDGKKPEWLSTSDDIEIKNNIKRQSWQNPYDASND